MHFGLRVKIQFCGLKNTEQAIFMGFRSYYMFCTTNNILVEGQTTDKKRSIKYNGIQFIQILNGFESNLPVVTSPTFYPGVGT